VECSGKWRDADYGILVDEQLIVVPAEAGVYGPIAEVDKILDEGGLLEVGTAAGECEGCRRAGVEGRERIVGIGSDGVAEVLVEKDVVGFDSSFPLLMAAMHGDGGVEIAFFEVVVLEGD